MLKFENIIKTKFLLNDVETWLWFLGILVVGLLLKRLVSLLLTRLVYQVFKKEIDTIGVQECIHLLRKPIEFLLTLIVISLALDELTISTKLRLLPLGKVRLNNFVDSFMDFLFIVALTWVLIQGIRFFSLIYRQKALETASRTDEHIVPFIRDIAISVVLFTSFFFVLGFVFKQNVASLITGLGVGGVAVALAARETLENFFASFTLFTDQPFIVGDTIEVGEFIVTVEKVGFRTTKARNVDGSYITIPNKLLVSQVVNNLSQREFFRIKYLLHLKLDTPIEKVENSCHQLQNLLRNHEQTANHENVFVRLDAISEFSLAVLVLYFVNTHDINTAKKVNEEVNLKILEILAENQVELAQPLRNFLTTGQKE